ncbi:MAG TPA: bifunctional enoyl-CoA hydratase/phosphate acetyltransferase [Spirochaetota bacterium]|nr:bifunctional enoyl-CoA hydratase/phosphate acetyltransferase [Spirochaetota bacterium]
MIKRLSDLEQYLRERNVKTRLVVVAAQDENVIEAVVKAKKTGIVDVTLVGNQKIIEDVFTQHNYDLSGMDIINEENNSLAGVTAVRLIKEKKAHILMNGQESYFGASLISKPILDKQNGIVKGKTMSHVAVFELENYHKLVAITDVAVNIAPDLKAKAAIISNAVFLMRRFGIETPKVAVLAAIEVVNDKMPATMDAAMLSKMAQRGQIKNCIIDGPLAFDNAISEKSALQKGIISEVSGDVDILLAPDIETAGTLYQSFMFFANAHVASITVGASAPVVLTTKLDTLETRFNSILLSASTYLT